ncbi:MAG TPA: hypothetical protein PKZ52_16410 [Cellvibrionaceae bacterium]|nr:hypothetical protein [Cellvibrionaceae bacterium]
MEPTNVSTHRLNQGIGNRFFVRMINGEPVNDAEYVHTLLGYLPPALFHNFVVTEFKCSLPPCDKTQSTKHRRQMLRAAISQLDFHTRQQINTIAETIILLSDDIGHTVLDGFAFDYCEPACYQFFTTLPDQYQRSLWVFTHHRRLFDEALHARQMDIVRQHVICYSGFTAPRHLSAVDTHESRHTLQREVAAHLGCPVSSVAVEMTQQVRPTDTPACTADIVHIRIYHNARRMLMDCVRKGERVSRRIIRAETTHIIYEPAKGHIEVGSTTAIHRDFLAHLVLRVALQADESARQNSITEAKNDPATELTPIRFYDYQRLSTPCVFDLSEEPIAHTKVIELGYCDAANRTFLMKINYLDAEDIYTASKSLINPLFDFSQYQLNYAKLAVRVRHTNPAQERTISIVLRGDNECNIKSKHNQDRALCDRLLHKWHLIKDRKQRASSAHDFVAA